jgi:pimeloyl-ACP methyl ester carboxylesterase
MTIKPTPEPELPIQPFVPICASDRTAIYNHKDLSALTASDPRNELEELSEPHRSEKLVQKPDACALPEAPAPPAGGDPRHGARRATLNGLQIGYTDAGEGSPLLFVHGFPLSRGVWAPQVEAFKADHRVLAPDLRGFGESEATEGAVSMNRFAEDLYKLLQHLGLDPPVLVGHSMGGYVALAFAKAFPHALRGLVLVGTRAGADSPEAVAARRQMADLARLEGSSAVVDAMAPKMLAAGNMDPDMAAAVRGFMAPAKVEGLIGALLGMAERPDAGPGLGRMKVPTLVITGADDTLIKPSESAALAKAIPGAQVNFIPKAGHLVAFEQAEAFNAILKAWLAQPTLR